MAYEYRRLIGRVRWRTAKSIVFEPEKGLFSRDDFWVPRSVIRDGHLVHVGDKEIQIATWWLDRNRHALRFAL